MDPLCDLADDPFNMRRRRAAGAMQGPTPPAKHEEREDGEIDGETGAPAANAAPEHEGQQETADRQEGHGTAMTANLTQATNRQITNDRAKLTAEIDALRSQIEGLHRAEKRLKSRLRDKTEGMKDMNVELDEARAEAVQLEEQMEGMKVKGQVLQSNLERYRRWWLTDYYSLKVVLGLVPNQEEVKHIAEGAHGRYKAHSTEGRVYEPFVPFRRQQLKGHYFTHSQRAAQTRPLLIPEQDRLSSVSSAPGSSLTFFSLTGVAWTTGAFFFDFASSLDSNDVGEGYATEGSRSFSFPLLMEIRKGLTEEPREFSPDEALSFLGFEAGAGATILGAGGAAGSGLGGGLEMILVEVEVDGSA
ncbi:hypothetical protein NMY22_g20125 [Coprinellus aureogranulatus]|nr:hypothetical protein NMY22_g20125 [Coprinellus aureogranulatus]